MKYNMQESLIEAAGVRHAEERGWAVYKWSSPGKSGIHDRLHFKKGITFSIEYKATGKKATPKQRAEAVRLKAAGTPCRCFDNIQDAREFIEYMTQVAHNPDPGLWIANLAEDISSFDP